ncbi:MAG: site-specific DNA-methyltransferase [Dehalococcoidia bacterium]|nr:site-specific DNA-methyltransferase [Dehalococcoidia bacterium]MDH5781183.1 site-specific DNA-methyltransferase [Dehalococcoidia bacterium]
MPKKKDKKIREYATPSENIYDVVSQQLGLPIYSYVEEASRAVELPRSEYPDISFFNDIDINQWKAYDEIITDSLWLIGSRDKSGTHTAELHGNFIPQIPHQAMLRYTKRGEIVLDTFLGNGTTLIECKRLGRSGVGIELLPTLVERSRELIAKQVIGGYYG